MLSGGTIGHSVHFLVFLLPLKNFNCLKGWRTRKWDFAQTFFRKMMLSDQKIFQSGTEKCVQASILELENSRLVKFALGFTKGWFVGASRINISSCAGQRSLTDRCVHIFETQDERAKRQLKKTSRSFRNGDEDFLQLPLQQTRRPNKQDRRPYKQTKSPYEQTRSLVTAKYSQPRKA